MSGQIGGRALPFTGLMTLPMILVGLALTGGGFLLTKVRPNVADRQK
jgi:hypothetical protein